MREITVRFVTGMANYQIIFEICKTQPLDKNLYVRNKKKAYHQTIR